MCRFQGEKMFVVNTPQTRKHGFTGPIGMQPWILLLVAAVTKLGRKSEFHVEKSMIFVMDHKFDKAGKTTHLYILYNI